MLDGMKNHSIKMIRDVVDLNLWLQDKNYKKLGDKNSN